jgi:hypothetical protein
VTVAGSLEGSPQCSVTIVTRAGDGFTG